MKQKLADLAAKLNLTFSDSHLIDNAFVHRSYLNESKDFSESNERLEYLGDAVLELATSAFLYRRFPDYQEGMLTNIRAALVRTESLGDLASSLGFSDLIHMSKGEAGTGGHENQSILADTFEAFLGAVYLDQGMDSAVKLLEEYLFPRVDTVLKEQSYKDNKSLLQEIAQSRFKATPQYLLVSESGPDHDKQFVMRAAIGQTTYAEGSGKSKQAAQESAAKATLELLLKT